jgi:hypothetical protein
MQAKKNAELKRLEKKIIIGGKSKSLDVTKEKVMRSPKRNTNRKSVFDTEKKLDKLEKLEHKSSSFLLLSMQRTKADHPHSKIDVEDIAEETNIGKKISESITKKVIILILTMLVCLPMLTDSFYSSEHYFSHQILSQYIEDYETRYNGSISDSLAYRRLQYMLLQADPSFPIVNITSNGTTYFINDTQEIIRFRYDELSYFSSEDDSIVITVNERYNIVWL